ncbi:MAG: FAD-binding oxidoreductase [Planctomycetia bacterium]|nr:FAD-binding oxidoreductase [Planctomycetia bacterium]
MPDASPLPIQRKAAPPDQAALAAEVRAAFAAKTPIYPVGGGTALAYGLPAKEPGIGLSTSQLTQIVDYPARDMTITVEAGVTMATLAATLAAEGQQLPIDVPFPEQATIGGVIATNWSGPRRFGHGTIRDYVIGISAVDGRGVPFKAGGRVVKNVAGYDFCKLLTGSLGTLAVITQVTLKVKPIPEATAWVVCDLNGVACAEGFCEALSQSQATPVAIELNGGPFWQDNVQMAIGVEGTAAEVAWILERLAAERQEKGFGELSVHDITATADVGAKRQTLTDFAATVEAPLVVRMNVLPSRLGTVLTQLERNAGKSSFQSQAGNGIVNLAFHDVAPADVSRLILKDLQPMAVKAGGNVIVLSCPGQELTRQLTWGNGRGDRAVMLAVKQQFDPAGILNPGRFVY